MSYQKDSEEFIATICAEQTIPDIGSGIRLARTILRNAATIQRCEVLVCNSEAADRDRVPCPASKTGKDEDCCCGACRIVDGVFVFDEHEDVPRVQVTILRARQRIKDACKPYGIKPIFSGDPRGACVKLILPSGKHNSFGGEEHGYCVPTKE